MANNTKYTQEQYDAILKPRNLIALDLYAGMNTKIRHQCLACNKIWTTRPGVIRDGKECRHCYKLRVRKPLDLVNLQLSALNWELVDESEYVNSCLPLTFRHLCGNIIKSNLDRILRKACRCLQCKPRVLKNIWSTPVEINGRKYYSNIEKECCEYLIDTYGIADVILHKKYSINSKKECDAYIKSKDLYIEISTINKDWYLERIYKKRQLVDNFIFVSSIAQLTLYC